MLIKKIIDWINENKLIVNTSKTKLMLFTQHYVNNVPVIHYNSEQLKWVTTFKYLQVLLDENLNSILHTREIMKKLSKNSGKFYLISKFLPQYSLFKYILLPCLPCYYTRCNNLGWDS